MGRINRRHVRQEETRPIKAASDAQKKDPDGIALEESADPRKMEFLTQVAQEEEEGRGESIDSGGVAIYEHCQAEEVVIRGSKENQAAQGWRLGKPATSRFASGGTSGGVKAVAQRLEGQASLLAALTNSAVLREARLAQREQRLNERERLLESNCRGRAALAHDGFKMLERHAKVLQAQRDKALELVETVMRLLAGHQPRDAECGRLGGSVSEAAEAAVPDLARSLVLGDQSVLAAEEPAWLTEAGLVVAGSGLRALGAGYGRRQLQRGRGGTAWADGLRPEAEGKEVIEAQGADAPASAHQLVPASAHQLAPAPRARHLLQPVLTSPPTSVHHARSGRCSPPAPSPAAHHLLPQPPEWRESDLACGSLVAVEVTPTRELCHTVPEAQGRRIEAPPARRRLVISRHDGSSDEAGGGLSESARAAGRQVEVSFSRWESVEAGLAREAAASAAGRAAAAGCDRLAVRAEAAHAAARAVERFRRHRVEMARVEAVRSEDTAAEVAAGRACTQRTRVIARAEANLRPARREWQRDQAAGGLEGWGLGGERSEEERLWWRSRG